VSSHVNAKQLVAENDYSRTGLFDYLGRELGAGVSVSRLLPQDLRGTLSRLRGLLVREVPIPSGRPAFPFIGHHIP
jgi:hypothetical protein